MNTKQLWSSLTFNCITNPYFDGVFSSDTLIDIKKKPELIICNTDPSTKPGEHWVLFFFDSDNSVDFYDSLGKDISYYGIKFLEFVQRFADNLTQSSERTQPVNSSLCGEYCLFYAYHKCKRNNNKMETILEKINSSDIVKFVHNKFYCETFNKCILLHQCKKY